MYYNDPYNYLSMSFKSDIDNYMPKMCLYMKSGSSLAMLTQLAIASPKIIPINVYCIFSSWWLSIGYLLK